MQRPDLILIHPPSVFRFREEPSFYGPVSDVVPSTSIFEIYPIGFITISEYLHRHGISVRIINLALKMLRDGSFDPATLIMGLEPLAFGIDLHWLTHADGSLSLAGMIKEIHPETPVFLGGLSASYYHEEIMMEHPYIDFIVRGDSTEEPLRLLIEAIRSGGGYESVPNLVWRADAGRAVVNEISYSPENMDYIRFDYQHLLKMAIKYRDPLGYIPFKNWLSYPVTAVFQCRGCYHNCASCGGSRSYFRSLCMRENPCFRSPELLAGDIKRVTELTDAPVMVIGDLLQAGEEYAERFLASIKSYRIKNEIAIEFFSPPPVPFIRRVSSSIINYNVEMSPESHDLDVRGAFGKHYSNEALEGAIEAFIENGCRRVDLFFMVGLPRQDYLSVMETIEYCEGLLKRFSGKRLLPMIAPLAPFIDPGSSIFEEPDRYGYRLLFKTLREHREAMLRPSWRQTLNYETEWMSRDDIVRATYDAAERLILLKAKLGIMERERADAIVSHIEKARGLIERIEHAGTIDNGLREEIRGLNSLDSISDTHELEWPIKGRRLKIFKLLRSLLSVTF